MKTRYEIILAGLGCLLGAAVGTGCGTKGSGDTVSSLEVHAHRGGAALRPENSLTAFKVAIQNVGVTSVELDIHQTTDNQLVINHDYNINPDICLDPSGQPIAGQPMISEMTLAEVRQYDCGTLVGLARGTPLATLEEVFSDTAGLSSPESKAQQTQYDLHIKWDPDTIEATPYATLILNTVRAHGMLSRVHFMNDSPALLAAAHQLEPTLSLFYLVNSIGPNERQTLSQLPIEAILPLGQSLTDDSVTQMHQLGVKVIAWTVDNPYAWISLARMKVDGILTDNPLGLREILEGDQNPLLVGQSMSLGD